WPCFSRTARRPSLNSMSSSTTRMILVSAMANVLAWGKSRVRTLSRVASAGHAYKLRPAAAGGVHRRLVAQPHPAVALEAGEHVAQVGGEPFDPVGLARGVRRRQRPPDQAGLVQPLLVRERRPPGVLEQGAGQQHLAG